MSGRRRVSEAAAPAESAARRKGVPPAARARELGLVLDVVPASGLRAAVDGLLAELGGCAPRSLQMAKAAIDRGIDVGIDEGLRIERQCYDVTLFSEDRDEGLRAFAEKRPPKFTGR